MIVQQAKLIKYNSTNNKWDLASGKTDLPPIGSTFWVRANSWGKRQLGRNGPFFMSVLLEDGQTWVPVEIFDFQNVWEERG